MLGALACTSAAACSNGAATSESPPSCRPLATAAGDSLTEARAVAKHYVADIAAHSYDAAARETEPCNRRQYAEIRKLWKFMAGMPVGQSLVTAHAIKGSPWPGSARVTVTVEIRFGKAPYSAWITAATRTLRLDSRPSGWRVTTDLTKKRRGKLSAYGFSSYRRPEFLSGRRATVVYSAASDHADAEVILGTADNVIGSLWKRYGGGRSVQRPILFLVTDRKQAERLAHVSLGKVRTPAGFEFSSYAYIDLPQWETYGEPADQRSMIVHELTHVATRSWVETAPHSLAEGVAMYEENRWRVQHHLGRIPLFGLRQLYRQGTLPTALIWQRRETDWGLSNLIAIQYSYLDAMTMVQQVVAHHGGIPGLQRLAAAFRARAGRGEFTAADVDAAFVQALGVSFDQVVAEAHAAVGA
ncbi:MAG: hypothetical protein QOF08_1127 [Gaiellales bacterium]|nr:hypothetical protein [Gaiellales bacterium]